MKKKDNNSPSFPKQLMTIGLVVLLLVVLIATFFGQRGLFEISHDQMRMKALVLEKEVLLEKKRKLERDIQELENNPKVLERKARGKLWYIRPGEFVIFKKKRP